MGYFKLVKNVEPRKYERVILASAMEKASKNCTLKVQYSGESGFQAFGIQIPTVYNILKIRSSKVPPSRTFVCNCISIEPVGPVKNLGLYQ